MCIADYRHQRCSVRGNVYLVVRDSDTGLVCRHHCYCVPTPSELVVIGVEYICWVSSSAECSSSLSSAAEGTYRFMGHTCHVLSSCWFWSDYACPHHETVGQTDDDHWCVMPSPCVGKVQKITHRCGWKFQMICTKGWETYPYQYLTLPYGEDVLPCA